MARPRNKRSPKGLAAAKPLLAVALAQLARTGAAAERSASYLIGTIREGKLRTLEAFDEAVKAAFEANGWNTRAGKPEAGSERRAVPHTVRTYVWEIRSAFREGVEVWKLRTMYEVRMARAAAKANRTATTEEPGEPEPEVMEFPPEVQQDLEGVRVLAVKQPNGALWHDAISLFVRLPTEHRAMYGRQIARIMHKYQGLAPAPVEPVKKKSAA
jgi:hypothetical protein